jgi:hypothetical protein
MTKKRKETAKRAPRNRRFSDPAKWLAHLRTFDADPLFPDGRNQPMIHTDAEKKRFFKLADQLTATSDHTKRERIKAALARIAFGK